MATPSPAVGARQKRRIRPFLVHTWGALTILLAVLAAAFVLYRTVRPRRTVVHHLAGYITDVATLQREYAHFQGKPLKAMDIQQRFEEAAAAVEKGDYYAALELLLANTRQAPLPVLLNDLGVLYVQVNDRAHAINAFREALARDAGYVPVRANMNRLKGFTSNLADPVSTEVEPNDSMPYANPIAVDRPVEAEISTGTDHDYFHVVTPPAPRDRLEIAILNRSSTLVPRLRVYDEEGNLMPWAKSQRDPGEALSLILAPPPNTTLYLDVSGDHSTSGAYTLTVKGLKQYDTYEPNDEIYSARKVALGEQIEANIMDSEDTDFYAFEGRGNGTVEIVIQNRSATLIPAITTFTPDLRTSGFGPDVDRPGGSLHYSVAVQEGLTYYVQVWSQARTGGEYTLVIR